MHSAFFCFDFIGLNWFIQKRIIDSNSSFEDRAFQCTCVSLLKSCLALLVSCSGLACNQHHGIPGEIYDAGVVFPERTPKLSHRFVVVNSTGRAVKLTGENHSCACTTVDFKPTTLPPGQSLPVDLSFIVPITFGSRKIQFRLFTDCPEAPSWTYEYQYESFPSSRITPDRVQLPDVNDEAAVPPGNLIPPRQAWLELYSTDRAAFPSLGEWHPPQELRVELGDSPSTDIVAQNVYRRRFPLNIALKPDIASSVGDFAREVCVPTSQGSNARVLVLWRRTSAVSVAPANLSFGLSQPDDAPIVRTVVLRSTRNEAFRVLSIDSDSPAFAVSTATSEALPSQPALLHKFEVRFTPRRTDTNSFASRLYIKTDKTTDLSVACSAFTRSKSISKD